MTIDLPDLSDETLVAYLEGQLTRQEADMIADALNDSPPLAARLKAMETPIEELRPELAKMLEKMPKHSVPKSVRAHDALARRPHPAIVLIALFVGIGIGAVLF